MSEQRSCFLHGGFTEIHCPQCGEAPTRSVYFADADFDHAGAALGVKERSVQITKAQSEEWVVCRDCLDAMGAELAAMLARMEGR